MLLMDRGCICSNNRLMKDHFIYKRDRLWGTYRFYSNGSNLGGLRFSVWSSKAVGSINGKHYTFHTRGIFRRVTEVMDFHGQVLARIQYDLWGTKARIHAADETYQWKHFGLWRSKWGISGSRRPGIQARGGHIQLRGEGDSNWEWMVLAGFYIAHFYSQMDVVILIPVIVVIIASTQ